jgi:hypothetical protein
MEKLYVSDELSKYINSNLEIKIPKEFNIDIDLIDDISVDLKLNGIKRGFDYSDEDFTKVWIKCSFNKNEEELYILSDIQKLKESKYIENFDPNITSYTDILNKVKKDLESYKYLPETFLEYKAFQIMEINENKNNVNSFIDDLLDS